MSCRFNCEMCVNYDRSCIEMGIECMNEDWYSYYDNDFGKILIMCANYVI